MRISPAACPNFFALMPGHSPGVVAFLYWLCAWADPACRQSSEALNRAGVDMLDWLIGGIGGHWVGPIEEVRLVKHYDASHHGISFLRVNRRLALLLSDEAAPDDGALGQELGYWGTPEVKLLAICCEELPVAWQLVESNTLVLASWDPDPYMRLLRLGKLATHPLFKTGRAAPHPLVDEFRMALLAGQGGTSQFEDIPPGLWGLAAWRAFYGELTARFGGRRFQQPMGALRHPFCRIEISLGSTSLVLEDARFYIRRDVHPCLADRERLRLLLVVDDPVAVDLGIVRDHDGLKTVTLLNHDDSQAPAELFSFELTIFSNFLILQQDGRIAFQRTMSRLTAARDFLMRRIQIIHHLETGAAG